MPAWLRIKETGAAAAIACALVCPAWAQNPRQPDRGEEKLERRHAPSARVPHYRPPSLPVYHGEVLKVPHHPRYRPPAVYRPPSKPQPPSAPVSAYRPPPRTLPPAARAPLLRPPERDERGGRIAVRPVVNMTKQAAVVHETIAKASVARYVSDIAGAPASRDDRDRWYQRDGVRFCHRFDRDHDRHWFGFYRGGAFFWTVYWNNYFWWREARYGRWLSFWRDHWWWCSPERVYYVFIDDQYYRWTPTPNSVVLVPSPQPPPSSGAEAALEAPAQTESSGVDTLIVSRQPVYNYSADGTRMVQVEGAELSAYLYDNTKQDDNGNHPLIRYLGDGIADVHFSDTSRGAPLQIVLSVQGADGALRHEALDADGNALGTAPSSASEPAYGTPGAPGFDVPGGDLPPTEPPLPDGI